MHHAVASQADSPLRGADRWQSWGRYWQRLASRRVLVVGLLLASCGMPSPASDQPAKVVRIGWLSAATKPSPVVEEFREGLRDLGYLEGQNVIIDDRYAEGKEDQLPDLATKLVHLGAGVIVAGSTPAAKAAKNATSRIPIVMALSADPVGAGLVSSLARPGQNVTGLSTTARELATKQLEWLLEVVPEVSQIGIIWNPVNPATALSFADAQSAAPKLGVRLQSLEVRHVNDFEHAFEAAARQHTGAVIVLGDPLATIHRTRIAELSLQYGLPVVYEAKEFVYAGGLMAYGPSRSALSRRAAYYVDRILKGATPADLPVEQPMTFEFVINLKTAQALGLTIPPQVLLQATEVVQ